MFEVDVPDMPVSIRSLGKASCSIMGAAKRANDYLRVDVGQKERAKGA